MSKVLIRTPNHLGDCLMALPAIRALAGAGGRFEIDLLAPQWADIIFRPIPGTEIIPLESRSLHGVSAIRHQVRLLKSRNYDTAILLTPSFSSALAICLAGIKERIGQATDHRGRLLNRPLPADTNPLPHRSETFRRIMELFYGYPLELLSPRIKLSAEMIAAATRLAEQSGFAAARPLIAMAPQAVAESRRWGVSNYAALGEMLLNRFGGAIILIGTTPERDAGNIIALRDNRIANLCGRTDIGTAAACLAQADLFIGNDSGLAHLAAAVDIPIVVLSGADNPRQTSPLADRKTIIIRDSLNCISCVKNICRKRGAEHMRCMRDITVGEVFLAASRWLENTSP